MSSNYFRDSKGTIVKYIANAINPLTGEKIVVYLTHKRETHYQELGIWENQLTQVPQAYGARAFNLASLFHMNANKE